LRPSGQDKDVSEKLKHRTIWLSKAESDPAITESVAQVLHNVKGVVGVQILGPRRVKVSYNVRQITMQIIEALLRELGFRLNAGFYCRFVRGLCDYFEDIECTGRIHDQAEYTRDAFIARYLHRPHGCRDHRPEYLRRYL
jgi:hypothetical protein